MGRHLTLGQRIAAALEHAEMSQNELERLLFPKGNGRGRVNRYVSGARGQSTLDVELFYRMAKHLRVDFTWLVLGEGEMVR